MKKIFTTLFFSMAFVLSSFGQSNNILQLVEQGIKLHDEGNFEEAIMTYNKALEIDPNSELVNYEIGMTYFANGDYEKALKYSGFGLKNGTQYYRQSVVIYGSCLDELGNTEKAIKFYKRAIKDFPGDYMLHYNIAVSYVKLNQSDKAVENLIEGISNNNLHPSSHYLLGQIMYEQGDRVKSILPLYNFLLLEPQSNRSEEAYELLLSQLNQGVNKKSDKEIDVTIPMGNKKDDEFGAADLMISLSSASRYTEENKEKSDIELFYESSESIFKILGELKKKQQGLWWDYYVPLFYNIAKNGHAKAFSYYISLTQIPAKIWVEQNVEDVDNLFEYLNGK
jgi:tetratricopeptide (TPR) repeat protein